MKIWLNNREVKESDSLLPCYYCVFNKSVPYNQFVGRCLLRTFNLRKDREECYKGYNYENMA